MKSGKTATIQGNENVFVDSAQLNLKAKKAITLSVGKNVSLFSHIFLFTKAKLIY